MTTGPINLSSQVFPPGVFPTSNPVFRQFPLSADDFLIPGFSQRHAAGAGDANALIGLVGGVPPNLDNYQDDFGGGFERLLFQNAVPFAGQSTGTPQTATPNGVQGALQQGSAQQSNLVNVNGVQMMLVPVNQATTATPTSAQGAGSAGSLGQIGLGGLQFIQNA